MSMNFGVYVGPFLKCKGGENVEVDILTNGRLCSGRGELYSDDNGVVYLIPNLEVKGITRQTGFSKYSETPVISSLNIGDEALCFIVQYQSDIEVLRLNFSDISIEWGIVPYYQ